MSVLQGEVIISNPQGPSVQLPPSTPGVNLPSTSTNVNPNINNNRYGTTTTIPGQFRSPNATLNPPVPNANANFDTFSSSQNTPNTIYGNAPK